MNAELDHLVIAADSLEQGVAWCEATLGLTPGPGGEHPLMGTHNRLFSLAHERFPRAYAEIIAINPKAPPPGRTRWFDLDDAALQAAVREAPRLVHFVARTPDAGAALKALAHHGIDRGALLPALRETPQGTLRWQISVREDGQRLFYGALPTLIEWGPVHPADALPDSGVRLQSLRLAHPRADDLRAAHAALGLEGVAVDPGTPNLAATLLTPRGLVTLESKGL
ncbi:VOC family protein [Variovorax terrae]|uniref:VOC family protein n=1 Tax=Variovorax terrae TaxID=2923278 RepID=A0A9X1VQX9_9BURK|nr:VOC family protein [Variovorax terrae]MCJ0761682.1 VOC family protein [Variovorax terrae]